MTRAAVPALLLKLQPLAPDLLSVHPAEVRVYREGGTELRSAAMLFLKTPFIRTAHHAVATESKDGTWSSPSYQDPGLRDSLEAYCEAKGWLWSVRARPAHHEDGPYSAHVYHPAAGAGPYTIAYGETPLLALLGALVKRLEAQQAAPCDCGLCLPCAQAMLSTL